MSDWMWLAGAVVAALGLSALVSIYIGMAADTMGTDDRDNTKPADLWQGHERRKVRAGQQGVSNEH